MCRAPTATTRKTNSPRTLQWEYAEGVPPRNTSTIDWLNEMGADGWELVLWSGAFYFKREVPGPQPPPEQVQFYGEQTAT